MALRTANAVWKGGLKDGSGTVRFGEGAYDGAYSYTSRFEEGTGTNPEEMIAAAHAACYSMALSADLERAGHVADSVETTAEVTFEKTDAGWRITNINLVTKAKVSGIDEATFARTAEGAKMGCPVSNALAAVDVTLDATLVN